MGNTRMQEEKALFLAAKDSYVHKRIKMSKVGTAENKRWLSCFTQDNKQEGLPSSTISPCWWLSIRGKKEMKYLDNRLRQVFNGYELNKR